MRWKRHALVLLIGLPTSKLSGGESGLSGPTPIVREAARNVAKLLPEQHLSNHPLDAEIGQRWLRLFLKELDPLKTYFTQQDVDGFHKREKDLTELFRKGEVEFYYDIFKRFQERVKQRVQLTKELLAKDHDFSVDEDMMLDYDRAVWAKDENEAREVWRKRVKFEILLHKADGAGDKEARTRSARRLETYAEQIGATDDDTLLESALTSLARAFDPKSNYMSPKSWRDYEEGLQQQFDGLGIQIRNDEGQVVVLRVFAGGPAHKDGRLKVGDKIVGVDPTGAGKIQDVTGKKTSEVVKLIRGKRGTKVRIEALPAGQAERRQYTITRDKVETPGARGEIIEVPSGPNRTAKVGYIFLPNLYGTRVPDKTDDRSSTGDVRKILSDPTKGFKAQKVDVVLLDLRANSGGLLNEAIRFPDLFLDQGPIFGVKNRAGRTNHYGAQQPGMEWAGPVVVLTSRSTASGAEIIVGALQSHGRGLIVGEATSGVGTVQSLFDVTRATALGNDSPQHGVLQITSSSFIGPPARARRNAACCRISSWPGSSPRTAARPVRTMPANSIASNPSNSPPPLSASMRACVRSFATCPRSAAKAPRNFRNMQRPWSNTSPGKSAARSTCQPKDSRPITPAGKPTSCGFAKSKMPPPSCATTTSMKPSPSPWTICASFRPTAVV